MIERILTVSIRRRWLVALGVAAAVSGVWSLTKLPKKHRSPAVTRSLNSAR